MKHLKYPIVACDNPYMYEFCSEGPMGSIKKVILYQRIYSNLFNLGFGDWNEELGKVDDSSRSNNNDREKVLATVAYTALDFTGQEPGAQIFVEGSTPARTRLYQMGIANNLLEISIYFLVYGFINGRWEKFRRGRNYEAFLIHRK
jgi:hypothetical protein